MQQNSSQIKFPMVKLQELFGAWKETVLIYIFVIYLKKTEPKLVVICMKKEKVLIEITSCNGMFEITEERKYKQGEIASWKLVDIIF